MQALAATGSLIIFHWLLMGFFAFETMFDEQC